MDRVYPKHLYEPIREEIAVSYLKHELRKLFRTVPEKNWGFMDRDISDWTHSPELATPRDFWNGFHGIAMGFKLKIGLIYHITAENIIWKKERVPLSSLWFGVELQQTKVVGAGRQPAKKLIDFYFNPLNKKERERQLEYTLKLSSGTYSRDDHPVIIIQRLEENTPILSVQDGNRRLAKAVLMGEEKILAYVGRYTTEDKFPKNFWLPTSLLLETLLFARRAYESKNEKLFSEYISVLKDMIESAKYEFTNRALTTQQPFRNDVLKALGLPLD